MKIMKCLNAILIITFIQISPYVYAGELSIGLSERLQYVQEEEYISAIIRMTDQADLKVATKGIVGRNKALRSRNVIRKLQSTAKERQEDLITLLEKEKSLGNVLSYTSFWIFNGLSIEATPAVIEKIASLEDVEIINLDHPIAQPAPIQTATPDETMTIQANSPYTWNIEKLNAPEVWEMGYDGSGIVVGVFDSGVDITHPDLEGKYRGGDNSWFDPFGEQDQIVEYPPSSWHGTHVTGIILGGNASGKHIGVAPSAQFIAARNVNDTGDFASVSEFHKGLQWFLDPDGDPETDDAPDIVNCSWDMYERIYVIPPCRLDLQDDMKALRAAGIIPVCAAGGFGLLFYTSSSPASYPETIAVGATTFFDRHTLLSGQGPNKCFSGIFPDICAPGRSIRSSVPNDKYLYNSGASPAAPHVTGVIALMLDANPDLTVEEIESILKTTAKPLGIVHPNNTFGWGRVDALAAVNAALALE